MDASVPVETGIITRRDFLKISAAAGTKFLGGSGFDVLNNILPKGIEQDEKAGVTTYFPKNPLSDSMVAREVVETEDKKRLKTTLDELTQKGLTYDDIVELRKEKLEKGVRFVGIAVAKRTYDLIPKMYGYSSFEEYLLASIAALNLIYKNSGIALETKLNMVVVLNDTLFSGKDLTYINPKENDQPWSSNNFFGSFPLSLDSFQFLDPAYPEAGRIMAPMSFNGRTRPADYGFAHDLVHHFSIGDLYWESANVDTNSAMAIMKVNSFPEDNMANHRKPRLEQANTLIIKQRLEKGYRGVFVDGPIVSPETVEESRLKIVTFGGREIKIDVFRTAPKTEQGTTNKPAHLTDITGTNILSAAEMRRGLLLYAQLDLGDNTAVLPLPRSMFSFPAIMGEKIVDYQISVNEKKLKSIAFAEVLNSEVIVRAFSEVDFKKVRSSDLYAWTKVPRHDLYFCWYLKWSGYT